jgi:enediyne biosynthesis protein E3
MTPNNYLMTRRIPFEFFYFVVRRLFFRRIPVVRHPKVIDTISLYFKLALIKPSNHVINAWKYCRRGLFSLSSKEISFNHRGFHRSTDRIRQRLETVGGAFVEGYNLALEHGTPEFAASDLSVIDPELQGFAFEGAGMGFALLDRLTPWRRDRISRFLQGDGDVHAYMVHVGAGWVWARFPFGFRRQYKKLDPLLGWLAFDGWGFHEGFFYWPKYMAGRPAPKKLIGYERRVFDQGLGRSFWFVNGGNIELIAQMIANFSSARRSDLWSGIGLAATYAGMTSETSLAELRARSGSFSPQLAQGAAFAAKARQRAGNLTDYTSLATNVLCRMPALEAARLCDQMVENLPDNFGPPAFEIWRQRIQNHFTPNLQPK